MDRLLVHSVKHFGGLGASTTFAERALLPVPYYSVCIGSGCLTGLHFKGPHVCPAEPHQDAARLQVCNFSQGLQELLFVEQMGTSHLYS